MNTNEKAQQELADAIGAKLPSAAATVVAAAQPAPSEAPKGTSLVPAETARFLAARGAELSDDEARRLGSGLVARMRDVAVDGVVLGINLLAKREFLDCRGGENGAADTSIERFGAWCERVYGDLISARQLRTYMKTAEAFLDELGDIDAGTKWSDANVRAGVEAWVGGRSLAAIGRDAKAKRAPRALPEPPEPKRPPTEEERRAHVLLGANKMLENFSVRLGELEQTFGEIIPILPRERSCEELRSVARSLRAAADKFDGYAAKLNAVAAID